MLHRVKTDWFLCPKSKNLFFKEKLKANDMVVPNAHAHHFYIKPLDRIQKLFNAGTFKTSDRFLLSSDPINFKSKVNYTDKIKVNALNKHYTDSIVSGYGYIGSYRVYASILDFNFLGGSIGSVVGEKITRCIERAYSEKKPIIIITSSGGARMHEGVFSLFQLAKINLALNKLTRSKLPYISILTNPSLGGATASFATMGDLIIAEPESLIGFAGPRVIRATTNKELPSNFQTPEFLLQKGLIDKIIHRGKIRDYIIKFLNNFFSYEPL